MRYIREQEAQHRKEITALLDNALCAWYALNETTKEREDRRSTKSINQTMVEVKRGDMEHCITLWTDGIEATKVLKSTELFHETIAVYRAMRTAWPGEQRIIELQDI